MNRRLITNNIKSKIFQYKCTLPTSVSERRTFRFFFGIIRKCLVISIFNLRNSLEFLGVPGSLDSTLDSFGASEVFSKSLEKFFQDSFFGLLHSPFENNITQTTNVRTFSFCSAGSFCVPFTAFQLFITALKYFRYFPNQYRNSFMIPFSSFCILLLKYLNFYNKRHN